MIDRYSLPEMAALFTDEARFARWLEIELLATEAWAALGVVPAADAECGRAQAPVVDAAFVAAVADARGGHRPRRRRVRRRRAGSASADRPGSGSTTGSRRPTSSTPRCAATLTRRRRPPARRRRATWSPCSSDAPSSTATRRWSAAPTASTPSRRRSAPSWPCGACRSIATAPGCVTPARPMAVGKLSGAVGTYSNIDPAVEASRVRGARPRRRCRRRR